MIPAAFEYHAPTSVAEDGHNKTTLQPAPLGGGALSLVVESSQ